MPDSFIFYWILLSFGFITRGDNFVTADPEFKPVLQLRKENISIVFVGLQIAEDLPTKIKRKLI